MIIKCSIFKRLLWSPEYTVKFWSKRPGKGLAKPGHAIPPNVERTNTCPHAHLSSEQEHQPQVRFRGSLCLLRILQEKKKVVTFPDPFKSFVLCRFLTDDRTGLHVQMFSECTPQLHVVHVQSLLVPLTIPGTKFSTRLHVQCAVNSLHNCTCSARAVPCGIAGCCPLWT